jgi:hypothetical protein
MRIRRSPTFRCGTNGSASTEPGSLIGQMRTAATLSPGRVRVKAVSPVDGSVRSLKALVDNIID